ncbi:2162_t:CDS:2 [Cetraspora pellucida]|uniref:2162_t:CDS:1 n=1 Tax=Cetraspora pellucida TaxID=1433469 RepID=A0ACA9K281_9GLOM|nr:2162_t:CDS:2 [Cetraspora pellucida]
MINKVLEAKRANDLAHLWHNYEELVQTIRDVLNQRKMVCLRDKISEHKDLASFDAFGHHTKSMLQSNLIAKESSIALVKLKTTKF